VSKKIYRNVTIILGGQDVSDWVTRWKVGGDIGELYTAEIDLIDSADVVTVEFGKGSISQQPRRGGYAAVRVATDDIIKVRGVDVSDHIYGYDRSVEVGKAPVIRLYIQVDSDILTVNGTHPWEEPA